MKKYVLIPLLLLLTSVHILGQGSVSDRKDLHDLIDARRQKFDAYSGSLEKKSGFFGNKTKKDIQKSTDVLVEIIETDNRIIALLNRVVDLKNFQKVNRNYDMFANDQQVNNLRHATDTLLKQVDALALTNATLKSSVSRLQWLVWFLFVSLLTSLIAIVRNKYFVRDE